MLARALEESGLSTTTIVLLKEHAQRVKPPRALFVPFPYGFALGRPQDPPFQHKVLAAALDLLPLDETPVLAEFPEEGDGPVRLLHAGAAREGMAAAVAGDPADEVTSLRGYYERWVEDHDGRTTVGLSQVPQRRWRGLVWFLEGVAAGADVTYDERPDDIPVSRFIRLATDDLKAFYMEARMAQRPGERYNDIHGWFWTQTSMGDLVVRVADRMKSAEDETLQRAGNDIAR